MKDIDFEVGRRIAWGELTLLDELRILEGRGLVERVQHAQNPSFLGWRITPHGADHLAAIML